MDTSQKTESIVQLVTDIERGTVALPEFQRDFVWEVQKTYDLFDSFIREIFVGSLIYGVPSFEITIRQLDDRPKTGRGSRRRLALTSVSKAEIERLVKTQGFRLLLDGQQRATSIFRALKGIDPVYFSLHKEAELSPEVVAVAARQRSLEMATREIRGDPDPERVNVNLSDVFKIIRGEVQRDAEKAALFVQSSPGLGLTSVELAEKSPEFDAYLAQVRNLEVLCRQEKLVAYYLLDTDEEKFALFFERSNSKGIQLDFIDILAAKLYVGFNLRHEIQTFEATNALQLHREGLVRAISYVVSSGRDTSRAYILGNLTHTHFTDHWTRLTQLYLRCYGFLFSNRLLIHRGWLPYENLMIPMVVFLQHIPHNDFANMSERQRRVLIAWYWLAIFSRRFSSAAQTSVLEDSRQLEQVAKGNYDETTEWLRKLQPEVKSAEDLLDVTKQYDAVYKGILNFVHHTSNGLVSWQGNVRISQTEELEDHHIFPKEYLRKMLAEDGGNDLQRLTDTVVNRTLIPKLQNIRFADKPPSVYLAELKNPHIEEALRHHMVPAELVTGAYDDVYQLFLEDRASLLAHQMEARIFVEREALMQELRTERKSAAATGVN